MRRSDDFKARAFDGALLQLMGVATIPQTLTSTYGQNCRFNAWLFVRVSCSKVECEISSLGEGTEGPPEHQLYATLRALRRQVWNGRLCPDEEPDLGDEV